MPAPLFIFSFLMVFFFTYRNSIYLHWWHEHKAKKQGWKIADILKKLLDKVIENQKLNNEKDLVVLTEKILEKETDFKSFVKGFG